MRPKTRKLNYEYSSDEWVHAEAAKNYAMYAERMDDHCLLTVAGKQNVKSLLFETINTLRIDKLKKDQKIHT